MADITYIVSENSPQSIPGFEQYSNVDRNLIDSFQINNLFDPEKHFTELHVYSLTDELLESDSNYTSYTFGPDAGSSGKSGASILSINPIQDSTNYGYPNGGVKLLYHFINDIFTQDKATAEFFISGISNDRTELRLLASTLDDATIEQVAVLYAEELKNQSYFDGFRLNFGNNDLLIGINIGTIPYNNQTAVTVKLYEPLQDIYDVGSVLNIVEVVSDSISYEVESQAPIQAITQPYLRPANFNIEVQDQSVVPSQYFSYDELFSYPVNNSNSEIYSAFNEKGINISVDYTDYSDFVHFSSAQERLINYKYKLDLITTYSASLSSISNAPATLAGTSGSRNYYNGLIQGIVSNFDHYERFLYYESSSYSWPKTNTTKPYTNAVSTTTIANTWYTSQIDTALGYDSVNNNMLVNTVPAYLRDDTSNENYLTFINMVGQHFDNLWLYGKAVTDKYNADNRIDFGISKDLVGEALKNFGVKLYTSNKSIEDLFTTIIGQTYQSGSEKITNYVTGSYTGSNAPIQPASYDTYQKEIQKRLYHNLPLLLNSKGTERGLRALINCYGIPSDILDIKYYGGRNTTTRPFFGDYQYYTSSLDKIRLDHTGSIVTGSTLSGNTSIIKRDTKYTDDLHTIEVGFSPTDNVDAYIISQSSSTFTIDEYIGDPRSLTSGSYTGLYDLAQTVTSGLTVSGSYDLQDYVRLIKFFDNTIFKTIKDFIPARVVADTGIIIKPNILNRSKAKSVTVVVTQPQYTGSIDTAFISGSNGNSFGRNDRYTTSWTEAVQTPLGLANGPQHSHEEPKFDGEFSGSILQVSNGELNQANIYKEPLYNVSGFNIALFNSAEGICVLTLVGTAPRYVLGGTPYPVSSFFAGNPTTTQYTLTYGGTTVPITSWPYTFTGLAQYQTLTITADNATASNNPTCVRTTFSTTYGVCDITANNPTITPTIIVNQQTDLTQYFSTGSGVNTQIQYTVNGNIVANPANYVFDVDFANQTVPITLIDTGLGGLCSATIYAQVIFSLPEQEPFTYYYITRQINNSWGASGGQAIIRASVEYTTYGYPGVDIQGDFPQTNQGTEVQKEYYFFPENTLESGYVLYSGDWYIHEGTDLLGLPYSTGPILVKRGTLRITVEITPSPGSQSNEPTIYRVWTEGEPMDLLHPFLSISNIDFDVNQIICDNSQSDLPVTVLFRGTRDIGDPFDESTTTGLNNGVIGAGTLVNEFVNYSVDENTFEFSPSTLYIEANYRGWQIESGF